MTDANRSESPAPLPGGEAHEAARLRSLSRFFKVFISPGEVFEDVRRDHRDWWVPILVGAVTASIFGTLYVGKYDMPLVVKEQLRESAPMQMVSGLMGPEARDKALEKAVEQIKVTPVWQLQVGQWTQSLMGFCLVAWFFTFLYGLMALAMGWLGGARASKLFISLGLIAAIMVVFIAVGGALQIVNALGAPKGPDGRPEVVPTPAWMALVGAFAALAATALTLGAMRRLAREPSFGRILAAVSYGMAPSVIGALIGIVIVLVKVPDVTPPEELVPSTLTALLNLKDGHPVLASLGSAIGLFSIWSIVLTAVGLAKTLGRRAGQALTLVLIPSVLWVLLKTAFAALFA